MSREVRHVPKDWEHPKDDKGEYIPLFEDYRETLKDFMLMLAEKGLQETLEYHGYAPNKDDYMPDWIEKECTHLQMYETVSEGTPISPVLDSPENLAKWLTKNDVDYYGRKTNIGYEAWLRVCNGGSAPTFVLNNGVIKDGVSAFEPDQRDSQGKE